MKLDQLIIESRKLPRKERALFALELVRGLEDDDDPDDDPDVHGAWTAEIQRRHDEVRSGAVVPLTLSQVHEVVAQRRKARSE
ncbi:addiction module protein [Paraliomyxa miuraensis]|uniref:addiction module protein n=1 Tax=Paraliomyxa miuraensis TaxID=376150 RepID=UPI00225A875A|nr:addiction module protein [Paraliomyxa miuraensis]MCX4241570.1 addiction module protein [Paraliomyxa miuraensis]